MTEKTVFVLGAGFTRALAAKAPLLVDDYDYSGLMSRFGEFRHAADALKSARAGRKNSNRLNLERLLTRLDGMPYDPPEARREFALLGAQLRRSLIERFTDERLGNVETDLLNEFAEYILEHKASVVTFNYDDVLDRALYRAGKNSIRSPGEDWNLELGYGFYCRSSEHMVLNRPEGSSPPTSLLLKLHGSINWRSPLGESPRRGPTALLHHESWRDLRYPALEPDRIDAVLEPEPFIVPPVLMKTELGLHPVLSVVWRAAHRILKEAARVVFLGYSLPVTDLAVRTLFEDTVANRSDVRVLVVDMTRDGRPNPAIRDSYRSLFPNGEPEFDFRGAAKRIRREFTLSRQKTRRS